MAKVMLVACQLYDADSSIGHCHKEKTREYFRGLWVTRNSDFNA